MKKALVLSLVAFGLIAETFSALTPDDRYFYFSTQGKDCYADGTPLLDGECYAVVWRSESLKNTTSGLFDADGNAVDPDNCQILAILSAAKRGVKDGQPYAYAEPAWVYIANSVLGPLVDNGVISLFALDTRIWNGTDWVVGGKTSGTTVAALNGYGLVDSLEDLKIGFHIFPHGGRLGPDHSFTNNPDAYMSWGDVNVPYSGATVLPTPSSKEPAPSRLVVEALHFKTTGNDRYADETPVMAGECYALVWQRTGTEFPGLPKEAPDPADREALGEDFWIAGYYPAATGDVAWACCSSVTVASGTLPVDEATNGTWTVYLLDTRYETDGGATACGFDPSEANMPQQINFYAPVAGLTDFELALTASPLVATNLVGGATVANQKSYSYFEVTLDSCGGTPASLSVIRKEGTTVGSLPDQVTRQGYAFAGWYTERAGGEAVTPDTVVTGDVTYYAQWTANKYKVMFDKGDEFATGAMDDQPMTYGQESALSSNLFARVGYTFAGWDDGEDAVVAKYADGAVVSNLTAEADATVTLYAVWTQGDNTVTFDANGGTADETRRIVKTDAQLGALPNASRTGYALAGWFTAPTGGKAVMPDTVVKGDVTYYAQWTANSYTVDFNERGGTGAMDDQPMTYDQEATLSSNLFTRVGYAFLGWTDDVEELDDVLYYDGVVVSNLTDEANGEYDLYAIWAANEYSVTFHANGGEGTMDEQVFLYDEAKRLTANAFVRSGYTFAGWDDGEDAVVAKYADGAVVSNLTAEADATVTLYAVWTANAYAVKFDANGGEGTMENQDFLYDEAQALTANAFVRSGYTFAGWADGEDAVVAKYADGAVVSNLTAETGATVTLYAVWTANSYTVDFNERGGEGSMEDQPMTYDQEAALSSNLFTRVGYAFLGWTDDEDELEEVLYYDGVVVSNLTDEAGGEYDLYAVWAANAYAVKFNANGGEGTMDEQVFLYDEAKRLSPVDFDREGYGFAGWATAADGEVVYADCQLVSNLTALAAGVYELFAVWTQGANDVRFDANGGMASFTRRSVKTDDPVGELPTAERERFELIGWFTAPAGGERISESTVVTCSVTYYAQWRRIEWDGKVENDWLKVTCAHDTVSLGLGEEVLTDADHYFAVDSGSTATLKVSGLPTGVKFDAKKRTMSGKATKKGVFYVTVTATNKSKFTQTRVMVMKVGGAEPDDRDEIGINCTALSNLVVGTSLPAGTVTIPSGASASGLPKGLKIVKKGAVDAIGTVCDGIEGIPTKGGKFTIKVTAKQPNRTTLLNVIVRDPGSKYIAVDSEAGGTATKSGVYAAGATLKLTAKAESKNAFIGWMSDVGDVVRPDGVDYRSTSLSMVVGEMTPARFTACFEPSELDAADGVAVVPETGEWTFDEKSGLSEFRFRVDSGSLPKVAIKPIPAGFAFNGAKDIVVGEDGEQYYRLVVKDAKKTKPGVYNLAFTVGNASVKQTPVTNLTLVVKNKRSGLYDLEYEKPYQVSVGVGDVSQFPAFAVPGGAKVSVSGLPSGLKYKNGVITGVATKAGEFTVTITTTINKVKVVDTVFMSVDALPAQLVGTFNGVVTNDDVLATEKLVLTATDKGKITAKIGTLSLSQTGWDCCADGKAYVTLLKSSGKGDKAVTNEIAMCVDTACTWNAQQVSGGYAVFTATGKSRSGISAQRNPFGKSGKTYECAEAHTLATNLAAQTKRKLNLYVTYDVGSAVWVIGDERTMKTKYPDLVLPDKAPLTVQVKDTGAVTLAGKLDKTHAASGSSVLSVDGENVAADFVIGKGEKKVVASLAFRQDAEGAVVVSGTAWTQAVE